MLKTLFQYCIYMFVKIKKKKKKKKKDGCIKFKIIFDPVIVLSMDDPSVSLSLVSL